MRKPGWYWCQWDKDGEWECSEWRGYNWDDNESSCQPVVVGERIPTPDEPWQCVPIEITDEMGEASGCVGYFGKSVYDQAQDMWSDMLAAAPKPETQP